MSKKSKTENLKNLEGDFLELYKKVFTPLLNALEELIKENKNFTQN